MLVPQIIHLLSLLNQFLPQHVLHLTIRLELLPQLIEYLSQVSSAQTKQFIELLVLHRFTRRSRGTSICAPIAQWVIIPDPSQQLLLEHFHL